MLKMVKFKTQKKKKNEVEKAVGYVFLNSGLRGPGGVSIGKGTNILEY